MQTLALAGDGIAVPLGIFLSVHSRSQGDVLRWVGRLQGAADEVAVSEEEVRL